MAAQMERVEQVKFIRKAQIEAEKSKLHTAQGKRIIPVLLGVDNNLNDIS